MYSHMDEYPSTTDSFGQAIVVVNRLIGLPEDGPLEADCLSTSVDITPIWRVIAPSEKDRQRVPLNKETFWGIDSIRGTLVCTEITVGDEGEVTPNSNHLMGIHCHTQRNRLVNLFVDTRPTIAPREMASMLNIPIRYAELVFTRGNVRNYPCVLAIKTLEASTVRYGRHEGLQQEFSLWSTFSHGPVWSREQNVLAQGDRLAREKKIAIYRGTIDPQSGHQKPLQLIAG
ncbi:MAG: hypothetical protein AB1414_21475 [bacterium]